MKVPEFIMEKKVEVVFVSSGNFSVLKISDISVSRITVFFFLRRTWKQSGHAHKFARKLSILRNGKLVEKDMSKIQILDLTYWKKALNKGCDKSFDTNSEG